jgi:hypothetical protein
VVRLLLIDGRADPNSGKYENDHALFLANYKGHANVVALLREDKRVAASEAYEETLRRWAQLSDI